MFIFFQSTIPSSLSFKIIQFKFGYSCAFRYKYTPCLHFIIPFDGFKTIYIPFWCIFNFGFAVFFFPSYKLHLSKYSYSFYQLSFLLIILFSLFLPWDGSMPFRLLTGVILTFTNIS